MKRFLSLLMAVCCVAIAMPTSAQTKKPLKFHGNPDYYLEVQGEHLFRAVDEGLDAFPPTPGDDIKRRLALYNLDALLHDYRYDNSPAFCAFVEWRHSKLIADLNAPHKKGLKIYKIYNDAFIARTKSVSVAFDISRCRCRGFQERIISDANVKAMVEHCDVMFLTHNHGDHVDPFVVDLFVKAGKPVIATSNILVGVEGVTHYRDNDGPIDVEVELKNGKRLKVKIYPGYQSKLLNNVYAVTTPENYTICHTGDLSHKRNFSWIPSVKEDSPRIDALLLNCWTNSPLKAVEGFNPRIVVTGHENEMGHTIDHREAYWLTFKKYAALENNYVVMAWGEWYTIK